MKNIHVRHLIRIAVGNYILLQCLVATVGISVQDLAVTVYKVFTYKTKQNNSNIFNRVRPFTIKEI